MFASSFLDGDCRITGAKGKKHDVGQKNKKLLRRQRKKKSPLLAGSEKIELEDYSVIGR